MPMGPGPKPILSYPQVKALAVLALANAKTEVRSGSKSAVYPGTTMVARRAADFLETHGLAVSSLGDRWGITFRLTERGEFRAKQERTYPNKAERWARAVEEVTHPYAKRRRTVSGINNEAGARR